MLSQVVSIGGPWGTAARAFNGTVQFMVALWLFSSVKGAYPRLRHWRAAMAGVWFALSLSLLAAPLHILPSEWTPWVVHGVLIVLGPIVVMAQYSANRIANRVDSELHDAMSEKDGQ